MYMHPVPSLGKSWGTMCVLSRIKSIPWVLLLRNDRVERLLDGGEVLRCCWEK